MASEDTSEAAALPLRIEARLPRPWADADRGEVRARLLELIRELGDDLGLRWIVDMNLGPAAEGELGRGERHRLLLDGRTCRVSRTEGIAADAAPRTIASDLFATLHANRSLLVGDALMNAALADLGMPLAAEAPTKTVEIVRRVVEEAVHRGFGIRTAVELCRRAVRSDALAELDVELHAALRSARDVELVLGPGLYGAVMQPVSNSGPRIEGPLEAMRDGLFDELGLVTPPVRPTCGEDLADREFRLRINDLRGPIHEGLAPGEALVGKTAEELRLAEVDVMRPARHPATGREGAVVATAAAIQMSYLEPVEHIVLSARQSLRRAASTLLTVAQVERNLLRLDDNFPLLVFNALERYPSLTIAKVCRALVEENISIRDLRSTLEALLEVNGTYADRHAEDRIAIAAREAHFIAGDRDNAVQRDAVLIEYVRQALKRAISHRCLQGEATAAVHLIESAIEARLREDEPLSPDEASRLIDAVAAELLDLPDRARAPVILTSALVRAKLRDQLAAEFPRLTVVAYEELNVDLQIVPISHIVVANPEA